MVPAVMSYATGYNKMEKMRQRVGKWYWVCPVRAYYERGELGKKSIDNYCIAHWESCIRYRMDERGEHHPDYMLLGGGTREELQW